MSKQSYETQSASDLNAALEEEAASSIAGLDALGHTFNAITGDYADQNSLNPLVAIDGLDDPKATYTVTSDATGEDYEVPVGVQYIDSQSKHVGTTADGSSTESYSSSLSVRAGIDASYGMYSGSVDASYGTEVTATSQEYYTTTFDSWSYYDLGFSITDVDTSTTDLDATDKDFCISSGMKSAFDALEIDTNGQNAVDFFNANGTHVLAGVVVGGQCRYSMYGTQDDFSSEEEFNVSAEAKYSSLTGSVAFEAEIGGSSSTNESSVESQSSVEVWGGSTTAQNNLQDNPTEDDYAAWSESLAENPAWFDYQGGGVVGIWDLCDDADKSEYLAAVFGQLYGSAKYAFETYDSEVTDCTNGTEVWKPDPGHDLSWTAGNTKEVMVGFGGNINSDKHIGKMIVVTFNVDTGEYSVYYVGGGDSSSKWEAFYMVPEGFAITGIGMSQASKDWSSLYVWYQELQFADQAETYLGSEISSWSGSTGDPAQVDLANLPVGTGWCAGGSSSVSDLQRYYQPEDGNQKVITGIDANSSNNESGFTYLSIEQKKLRISDSVSGADSAGSGD